MNSVKEDGKKIEVTGHEQIVMFIIQKCSLKVSKNTTHHTIKKNTSSLVVKHTTNTVSNSQNH